MLLILRAKFTSWLKKIKLDPYFVVRAHQRLSPWTSYIPSHPKNNPAEFQPGLSYWIQLFFHPGQSMRYLRVSSGSSRIPVAGIFAVVCDRS